MHVIWRDGLQDDDYLDRATVGADRLRRRVLEEYPPDRVAAITGVDVETLTTFAHRLAREQPSLIRLNYGLQRHHGGGMAVRTIACLPAIVGSWRHHGGGRPALDQRHLRLRDGPAHPPRPRPAGHADGQHEPARRGPGRRAARPAGPGPLRLQLQPGRRRARPGEGARGPAARRPVHRRPRAVPDRHGRLRRHRPARDDAARAPRPPRLLRPPLRDAQPPGDRPAAASAARTTTSSAPWPPGSASSPSCSPTTRP